MFNTFESTAPLRDAVGTDRFAFGFPGGVFSLITAGRIAHTIRAGTTVDDDVHARLFSAAGIPTVTTPDMQAWLRSHAALVVGVMAVGCWSVAAGGTVTWAQARAAALATKAAFSLVRALGHPVLPSGISPVGSTPMTLLTLLLWLGGRSKIVIDLGKLGPHEPRMLIDQMTTALTTTALTTTTATTTAALQAIRP